MSPFFAASSGWQTLITLLVFVVISLISTWLKRKQEIQEQEPPPSEPTSRPRRRRITRNWEEELRRLFEEKPNFPPAEFPLPPSSRPTAAERRQKPPPLPPIGSPVRTEEDEGLLVSMPEMLESTEAYRRGSQIGERIEERMRQRHLMSESTAAYQQAQKLDEKVAEHLKQLKERVVTHIEQPKVRTVPADILQARAMLRNRSSLRSAIVASLVLGSPKALEE